MTSLFTQITHYIQNSWKYVFGLCIIYAIFLRSYKLWDSSFWIDEGFSSYSTISWVNMQYYLHNISQLLSFNMLWVSDLSARVPSVIFSIMTIPLVFLISQHLFHNKKVSIVATLIFCFSYIEITWARQARFYTLLQFLFYWNIYLSIILYEKFSLKFFTLALFILYISVLFHPFLYTSSIIFLWVCIFQLYTNSSFIQKIQLSQIPVLKILPLCILLLSICAHQFVQFLQNKSLLGISSIKSPLSETSIQKYIDFYSGHLLWETGWLYIMFIISLFIFTYKRKLLESLIFSIWFLVSFYIISQKWVLFHTRYVFFLFPLIFIWGTYAFFYLWEWIQNFYIRFIYFLAIGWVLLFSLNLHYTPQVKYALDFTSPQVDFQSAYREIPDNADVISGFPVMCEWYYSQRGNCIYSLAINFVGNTQAEEKILELWKDSYTSLPYLESLDQLKSGTSYYFVLDALSQSRFISQELHTEILEKWEIYYNSGTQYKNIQIIKLTF